MSYTELSSATEDNFFSAIRDGTQAPHKQPWPSRPKAEGGNAQREGHENQGGTDGTAGWRGPTGGS